MNILIDSRQFGSYSIQLCLLLLHEIDQMLRMLVELLFPQVLVTFQFCKQLLLVSGYFKLSSIFLLFPLTFSQSQSTLLQFILEHTQHFLQAIPVLL